MLVYPEVTYWAMDTLDMIDVDSEDPADDDELEDDRPHRKWSSDAWNSRCPLPAVS